MGKRAEVQVRSRSTWRRGRRSRGPPVLQLFKILDDDRDNIRLHWRSHNFIINVHLPEKHKLENFRSGQTLQGSFSSVSKPNFASKYSLESAIRIYLKRRLGKRDMGKCFLKIISENYFWKLFLKIISENYFLNYLKIILKIISNIIFKNNLKIILKITLKIILKNYFKNYLINYL